ncbi:ALP1-like protein [Tanacetum coccineum]|uniref:ALP1-like protein n=1 Tax=Tanacetum coccineum TaxID=301880 RepID=A0ABQ5G1R7_9ASTR
MNQNFYNSNSFGFDQSQPPQFPVIHQPPQETSVEILQAKEDLMISVETFLKKFNRISFRETPKVLVQAWDKFLEIKHAESEEVQELLNKLLEDVQNISEELAEFINSPSWNRPAFYLDDDEEYTIAITPDLPKPKNEYSLSAVDDESSQTFTTFLNPLFDSNDDFTSSDDESLSDEDKAEFDLEEEIPLVENLSYDNSSTRPPEELNSTESFSPSPIPVEDSDPFMEVIDLFLASDESIPPGLPRSIRVRAPECDRKPYRTRKGEICTNVLGVCTRDLMFSYVLAGWEGSTSDSPVLRDAISRPNGSYYLCDAGYTNGNGFLTPYRGQQYHPNDWSHPPTTTKELYNMKHSSTRNVIERCFGLIKARWAILRDNCYHPIESMPRIIIACCLMHNFIRTKMSQDPIDNEVLMDHTQDGNEHDNVFSTVETSQGWSDRRDNLANEMFNEWNITHGN